MGILSDLFNYFSPKSSANDILTEGESHWWWPFGGGYVDTLAGERVSQASLMTSAACFACTKAISETLAGLPPGLFQPLLEAGSKKEYFGEAYELLCVQPNPEMDAFTFWELVATRVMNNGNFFAEIQRDKSDRPIAIWPIHPTRVQPMRDVSDGSLYWEVSSDYDGDPQFSDPTWRKKHLTYLSEHSMLNIVGFGSTNGVMSPGILPGSQVIGMDLAVRRYGADFFGKGATMNGVVEHPGFIAQEDRRNTFRQDINQIHSNRSNPHRIGVLWDDAKYKQISIPPDQAQFLETRKFSKYEICAMYGVPPAIIGDYEHSKFATADAMLRAFVMVTLRNLVVRVERSINRQILNVKNGNSLRRAFTKPLSFEMALDGLLRGDPKQQAETWKMMREAGAASANEWRQDVGMNPVPGEEGNYLIVPGGFARLDKIDDQGSRGGNSTPDESAQLPSFDKEKLIEMLQEVGIRPAAARGHDTRIDDAICEIGETAVNRIHGITLTQIARWKTQDPSVVAKKLPEFWAKQKARLAEALEPLSALSDVDLATEITTAYIEKLSVLDYHDLFDERKTTPGDTAEFIRSLLC